MSNFVLKKKSSSLDKTSVTELDKKYLSFMDLPLKKMLCVWQYIKANIMQHISEFQRRKEKAYYWKGGILNLIKTCASKRYTFSKIQDMLFELE